MLLKQQHKNVKISDQESRFPSGHTKVWKTWNTICWVQFCAISKFKKMKI
jgi:hypothetical protein